MSTNINLDDMKKQVVILAASCAYDSLSYAQDEVMLRDGSSLDAKIVKSTSASIEFACPDEELVNEKNKKETSYIVHTSSREEECNQTFQVSVIDGKGDWDKVVITYLVSGVERLTRVDGATVTSSWGGTLGSDMGYKDATKKLKKKATKLGISAILVADRTDETTVALDNGAQVVGVAHR